MELQTTSGPGRDRPATPGPATSQALAGGPRPLAGARILDPAQLALWFFLATVVMLFAAFSSAYLIRRAAADWLPVALPGILWATTAVLALSSVTLELGRRASAHRAAVRWVAATALFGTVFVAGQLYAWRQLAASGVYLPTNPHSAFFYILTGLHALHLAGGVFFVAWVALELTRHDDDGAPATRYGDRRRRYVGLCATYWHFLGALWVYLFAVLAVG